ncbi:vomeronasal type-1 receptor 4-like, partial [Peromyscus leucopus]|uniref:vomeronasal type-1 receptor 4-like n=1 Tax=Peromyscus leucopus TaxID=10041 RepID=UPI0018855012
LILRLILNNTIHVTSGIIFPCRTRRLTTGPVTLADSELAIGVIFLSQTVVGILGNSYILHHYLLFHFRGCRLRSTDWILMHLTIANILSLSCKGVPQIITAFGWKNFLDDFGCKGLFYLHRVGKGVSIGSTSFLSVFQAITISPRDSRWAELKGRGHKHIGSSVCLSWILYMFASSFNLVYVRAKYSKNNTANLKDLGYCAADNFDKISDTLYIAFLSVPDFLFVGLMVWASSFMVFILHRHKQRMQHMPRSKVSSRSSPESRATKTVLLLVSTFVFFYTLSCIFIICLAFFLNLSWLLVSVSVLVAGCFPTVSPFLLMSHFSSRSCCLLSLKKK